MDNSSEKPKTVSVLTGFFFNLNICIGSVFLGIPYAYFYGGYAMAVPTHLIISFLSWASANYLLEVTARAQALEQWDQSPSGNEVTTDDGSDDEDSGIDDAEKESLTNSPSHHPKFEITSHRKFEVAELCEIFVGRPAKYICLTLFCISGTLTTWFFATVAASAWATNIPFRNFGGVEKCEEDAFTHKILPSGGCLYAYYFCLTLFGIIVVTLSLLNLKRLAIIQVTQGFLRFLTITAMLLFCIVRLSEGGDACLDKLNTTSSATSFNNVGIKATVLNFNPKGWLMSVPILAYAMQLHFSIPTLVHPVKEKKYVHWMMLAVFIVSSLTYMSVGVVVPLWFQASIQETCTLNWAIYTNSNHTVLLRVFSHYLIIFPSLDVLSSFPLINHALVNNIYILIMGQDTSKKPKYQFDWFLRMFLRLAFSLVPVLAAFGVANLVSILKYAGFLSFMAYVIPLILHLRSIHVCKKKFAFSKSGSSSMERLDSEKKHSKFGSLSLCKMMNFLCCKDKQALYMTRYSNILISHPVSGWLIGAAVTCLLGLAFSSFFVQPDKLTCELVNQNYTRIL